MTFVLIALARLSVRAEVSSVLVKCSSQSHWAPEPLEWGFLSSSAPSQWQPQYWQNTWASLNWAILISAGGQFLQVVWMA